MKRIKIKIDNPDKIKSVIWHALRLGYKYNTEHFENIKYAQCLILHPEYGIYKCQDNEFCRMIDFETMSYEEFMSE